MFWNDYNNDDIRKIIEDFENKQLLTDDVGRFGRMHYWYKLADQADCTYVLNVGEDVYKIGKTWSVYQRLKQFRGSNPWITGSDQVVAIFVQAGNVPPYASQYGTPVNSNPAEGQAHDWCRDQGLAIDTTHRSELFKIKPAQMRELFDYLLTGPFYQDHTNHRTSIDETFVGAGGWDNYKEAKILLVPRDITEHMANNFSRHDAGSCRKTYGKNSFQHVSGKAPICKFRQKVLTGNS